MKVQRKEKVDLVWVDPKSLQLLQGNRYVNPDHVAVLKASMSKENLLHLNPIKVDSHMQIIDGQHRVEAAVDLGFKEVPCFVVNAGLEEAQKLNQFNRNWTVYDFARSYESLGNENYRQFRIFHEATGFDATACMYMLSGSRSKHSNCSHANFKAGLFKVKDAEAAEEISYLIDDFKPYLPDHYKSRSFVLAFLQVYDTAGYNHENMMHKLELVPIRRCPNCRYYVEELERIYNYKVSQEKKLRFRQT
jgi:hypothetical protein